MRRSISMVVVALVLGFAGSASALWFITDMFDQPSKKPQEGAPMTLPPDSVPDFGGYYPTNLRRAELAPLLPENPYAGENSGTVMATGKVMYDIYCAVCHGPTGMGDGPVAAVNKGIPPFPLLGVAGYSDQELANLVR